MDGPTSYRVAKSTRASNVALAAMGVVVVLLALAPAFVSRSLLQDLFFVLTMITLAQCWNLLAMALQWLQLQCGPVSSS